MDGHEIDCQLPQYQQGDTVRLGSVSYNHDADNLTGIVVIHDQEFGQCRLQVELPKNVHEIISLPQNIIWVYAEQIAEVPPSPTSHEAW